MTRLLSKLCLSCDKESIDAEEQVHPSIHDISAVPHPSHDEVYVMRISGLLIEKFCSGLGGEKREVRSASTINSRMEPVVLVISPGLNLIPLDPL